jgi:hypothetical protein
MQRHLLALVIGEGLSQRRIQWAKSTSEPLQGGLYADGAIFFCFCFYSLCHR